MFFEIIYPLLYRYDTTRARLNSGYVNILAHDNTKEYRDMQRQKQILREIQAKPMYAHGVNTPLTPDNDIVFVNHDSIIRRPREFKTPPPPKYGEESEYEADPRERFYDAVRDPNAKKFHFLDSREGTVSKHYQNYITSQTMKKRKKKNKYRNRDSLSDSENYDTIGELPGFEVQQPYRQPRVNTGYKNISSKRLQRAFSYSPNHGNQNYNIETPRVSHQDLHIASKGNYERNSTFKQYAPNIISQPKIIHMPIQQKSKLKLSSGAVRPIRSGAFQRINTAFQRS